MPMISSESVIRATISYASIMPPHPLGEPRAIAQPPRDKEPTPLRRQSKRFPIPQPAIPYGQRGLTQMKFNGLMGSIEAAEGALGRGIKPLPTL
jgi:hypothetical protein